MKRRIFILLLVVLLVLSALAGCKGGDATGGKQGVPGKKSGPPVELIWIMGDPGQIPTDQAIVEEKLDEISVRELNVKVKTIYYKDEKALLALSSGEDWDMCFTCEWFNNFAVQAYAGYFADITDKVQTLTPDLYATMPEIVWEGAKIDGKIMAIPVKKDYAAEIFWRFDKKLFVDTLGMEVKDKMTFFDATEFLKAAKKAYEDGMPEAKDAQYPLMLNKGGIGGVDSSFDMINRDVMLGIPYSAVGTKDSDKIVVTAEHPDLYDRLVALHDWYKAGYINPDAATTEEIAIYSAVKNGQGFYGADAIWSSGDKYTQLISKYSGPYLSTASIRGSMNAINANSDNIDLALQYQQMVNTNKQYRDILRYGVEGEHFTYTEEGLVKRTEKGVNGYKPWPFSQGSYSLSSVEWAEGLNVDPKMWEVIFKGYEDLVATNTIGFSFDIKSVEAQIAACKVIKDKYWIGLITGSIDPATEVPKMIKEMEAAGLRDIQAECQKQFDAFLAASKK
jgi:putative aldouronate transport system substrate-binding protein